MISWALARTCSRRCHGRWYFHPMTGGRFSHKGSSGIAGDLLHGETAKKYPDTTICRGEAYLIDYSLCNHRTLEQSHFRVVSRVTLHNVRYDALAHRIATQ